VFFYVPSIPGQDFTFERWKSQDHGRSREALKNILIQGEQFRAVDSSSDRYAFNPDGAEESYAIVPALMVRGL